MGIKTSPRPNPLGLNNNGLGRPLARWATRFLGQAVGHELFDDPLLSNIEKRQLLVIKKRRRKDNYFLHLMSYFINDFKKNN